MELVIELNWMFGLCFVGSDLCVVNSPLVTRFFSAWTQQPAATRRCIQRPLNPINHHHVNSSFSLYLFLFLIFLVWFIFMFIHYYSVIDFFKKKNNYCLISPSYSELVKELEVWRCSVRTSRFYELFPLQFFFTPHFFMCGEFVFLFLLRRFVVGIDCCNSIKSMMGYAPS